jgi:regulator of sigma E protease
MDRAVVPKAGQELVIDVVRDGQPKELRVTPQAVGEYNLGELGIEARYRTQIALVFPQTPAEKAGIKPDDIVCAFNGEANLTIPEFIDRVSHSAGKPVVLEIERGGQPLQISVVPEGADGAARIGVRPVPEFRLVDLTLSQAFAMSLTQNWESTQEIGKTLAGLFTRETPVRQLVGPVGIAGLAGSAAQIGWVAIFNLMAMISLNLGLLNLLPVPVLDGGHIAILAVEGLARRDFSIRVKERMLMAGAALIVLLMVTVIFNDISRILR